MIAINHSLAVSLDAPPLIPPPRPEPPRPEAGLFPDLHLAEPLHGWDGKLDQVPPPPAPLRWRSILTATCEIFGITYAELVGAERSRRLSTPRHIAMWIAAKHTRLSLTEIARIFGKYDHTVIIHARRVIDRRRLAEPAIQAAIDAIRARLA